MKIPAPKAALRASISATFAPLILTGLLIFAPAARAGLLFRYNFDEASGSALDSGAAPTANATLAGSATRVAGGPTGTGFALDLTPNAANNNYATPGVSSKLGTSLSQLTVVAWVNLRADPAANDRIVDNLTASTGFGFLFLNATQSASAAKLAFLANNTSSGANASTGIDLSNKWVMVAVTYDGTVGASNVRFYKGDPATSVSQLGSAINYNKGAVAVSANELRIGSTPASTSDRTPPAWMDNVRIYDTVLTQSELEAIRKAEIPATPASVSTQPTSRSAYDGLSSVTFNATVSGDEPISTQWYFNGTNALAGATNATLTLSNITPSMAGNYNLTVSNAYNTNAVWSSNAVLTVLPLQNTPQMSNLWNLLPGDRSYITYDTANNNERSLAFNPATSNLLVASRANGFTVAVLNPQTGAEKNVLNTNGIPADVPGSTLGLSLIGVGDDGAVYGGGLSVNATTLPYYLYRWPDDSAGQAPTPVFAGDPGAGTAPGLRWGDSLAVRGAGAETQILLAPGAGTNVVLLRTASGLNFTNEIPPTVIAVSGVPSGFAQTGVAFGPGTNTFWAKSGTNNLYLIQFDLAAKTGTVLRSYSGLAELRGISTDASQRWLAGVAVESAGHNARLYDIFSLATGPVLADQELFARQNTNAQLSGLASTAIGGGYVFTLNCNNGIKAFTLNHAPLPTSLLAASTLNPAGFNEALTFAATVQTNGVTAAGATGSVVFSGATGAFGTNSLSGGVATSPAIASLPRGTNVITMTYSGDTNFLPATNTLSQVVTNHPPVARAKTLSVGQGGAITIVIANGFKSLATDADGDALNVISIGNPDAVDYGTAVIAVGETSINYTNTSGSAGSVDTFSYVVADGFGGFATNTISVRLDLPTGANLVSAAADGAYAYLNYLGIPGTNYALDWATNLTPPITWTQVQVRTAESNGWLRFTNPLSAYPTNDFFRTRYVP